MLKYYIYIYIRVLIFSSPFISR